jgi:hypothetical protein
MSRTYSVKPKRSAPAVHGGGVDRLARLVPQQRGGASVRAAHVAARAALRHQPFQRHRAPALTSRSSRDSPAARASAGELVAPNPIRSARTR